MDAWLKQAREEIEDATAGICGEEWLRAPEGKWNCSHILEHLSMTFSGTARMLEKRLAAANPDPVPSPTLKQRIIHLLIFTRGEIPEGRTAPMGVRPKGIDGEEALRRILQYLGAMEEQIDAAEKRWGSSAYIALHPILGPLKADQWRRFHFIHTRHHMRQIKERRQAVNSGQQSVRAGT